MQGPFSCSAEPVGVRTEVLALLRRYGWNATSFQVLEPGFSYWFTPDREAAVAYVETPGWWIAAGAPICAEPRLAEVGREFVLAARARGREACFFGAADRLIDHLAIDHLQIGVQACWDPLEWSRKIPSSVAAQVRRAVRKGVEVRELHDPPAIRPQAEALIQAWLARHRLAPMRFLVDLDAFSNAEERRYFGAFREGALIGLLVAVPIYARAGWFLEDLVWDRSAPNGTSDALVATCLGALAEDGVRYATMGLAALSGLEPRRFLDHALVRARDALEWLYGFRGLHAFRARLKPSSWEPVYLCAPGRVTVRTILAVLQAFAGTRPLQFFAQSLRRIVPASTWHLVPAALAAALVPWMVLLVASDGARWFGAPWMPLAWAAFDLPVAAAFAALAARIRRQQPWQALARILLGVVLGDAWLTTLQALLYNLPRHHPLPVVAAAVAAPWLAAGFLAVLLMVRPTRS